MTKHFLDLLSADEQDDWQSMECWAYANDGERPSTEWGDGPHYLGLGLLDWVALTDAAPRLVEICGMDRPILTWRANHPEPAQRQRAADYFGFYRHLRTLRSSDAHPIQE